MPSVHVDPLGSRLRDMVKASPHTAREVAIILLQLVEEAVASVDHWRTEQLRRLDPNYTLSNESQGDFYNHSSQSILGISIEKIRKKIPSEFKILHIEPIFRHDLIKRFLVRQKEIHSEL
ncbi:hypothetical protein G7Y89_g14982 [Cudoniella acicularis]|uniref:Uncharacterized protein n=1 Tax=Cudoniella acicularis TaxID=354080 RepID=A0A8H4QWL3_9HELO|nr:hypothetical protein G7Y89_g14982 [Cudoniella acicularis]